MAAVFSEFYANGVNGQVANNGNTAFTGFVQNDLVFDNTNVFPNTSMSIKATASAGTAEALTSISPADTLYTLMELDADGAYPSTFTTIWQGKGSGAERCDVRVMTDGSIQLRNDNYVKVAQSAAGMVPLGGWVLIEIVFLNLTGQAQLRLWKTDLTGVGTPDYDTGLIAMTTGGQVDSLTFFMGNSTTWTANFGPVQVDNAQRPAVPGVVSGGGSGGTVTPRGYNLSHLESSGTSISITLPAGCVAGDLAILTFDGSGGGWLQTAPSGWTSIVHQSITSLGLDAWQKVLTTADINAGSVTVTSNNTGTSTYKRILTLAVYENAKLGDSSSNLVPSASTSRTAPAVNVVDPNAWIFNHYTDRASPGSQSWTLPANLTEREEFFGSGGAGTSCLSADQAAVGSGQQGSNTVTGTVSTGNAAQMTVAIEPSTATLGQTVNAGADQVVEPWKPVTITAVATGNPTGYTCDTISPSGVDLAPSIVLNADLTATITFIAPANIAEIIYKVRVTADYAGGVTSTPDDVNITVLPVTERFFALDGTEVPRRTFVVD